MEMRENELHEPKIRVAKEMHVDGWEYFSAVTVCPKCNTQLCYVYELPTEDLAFRLCKSYITNYCSCCGARLKEIKK